MSTAGSYSPQFIKATCDTSDLLAAIEVYEHVQCLFGLVTNAYVRAVKVNPNASEFEFRGVVFQTTGFWNRNLILSHVAKPSDGNLDVQTLRPFAELLVKHGIRQARLVNPNPYAAWVEVSKDGKAWRRLVNTTPSKQPAPATVIDANLPPIGDDLEVPAE